jgi:hypothetical protein
MRRIPNQLLKRPKSDAEVKIFDLFQHVNLRGFCLHSLNVSGHEWKPWTEIDFLLITPFGLMGLEVKGGAIRRRDGFWYTNSDQLKESPYDQVRTAIFEVRRQLGGELLGLMGWGVVTPDSAPLLETIENPRWMQAAEQDCFSAEKFGKWLGELELQWRSKLRRAVHPLTDSQMNHLLTQLRPNFDAHVPLGRQALHINSYIKKFTEEQLQRLDEFEENRRVICRGGAGTGKTFLAIEAAKRESAAGRSVLMVARSPLFTGRLRDEVSKLIGVKVWTFGVNDAPSVAEPFDVLIVDEGQDLLLMDFINVANQLLRGGLERGRWFWFMDDQNQAGLYADTDMAVLDLLRDQCGATLQRLRVNCRNTENIVAFTHQMTGANIGEAKVCGRGQPVEREFVPVGGELAAVLRQLSRLRQDPDIAKNDVVVLVMDPSRVSEISEAVGDQAPVHSVRDFKGCETNWVVVVGVAETLRSIEDISTELYTAVTRSRVGVWIIIPARLQDSWESVLNSYVTRRITSQG